MVLPLPGQVVVEVVQHGLPDYLVVGHGQEQEGAGLLVGGLGLPDDLVVGHGQEQEGAGHLVGGLGLERVQHELHGVLGPGHHGGDLDLDEELGGGHGQLLPNHLYIKYRELGLIWILGGTAASRSKGSDRDPST